VLLLGVTRTTSLVLIQIAFLLDNASTSSCCAHKLLQPTGNEVGLIQASKVHAALGEMGITGLLALLRNANDWSSAIDLFHAMSSVGVYLTTTMPEPPLPPRNVNGPEL
jgi:hypothetical protein